MEHNVSVFNKDLKFTKVSNGIINDSYCWNRYWIWLAGSEGISVWMLGYVRTELHTAISRSTNTEKTARKTHLGSNSCRQHKLPEPQDVELFLNTLRAEHLMCSYLIWHLKDLNRFHHEIYAGNYGFRWKFYINTPTQLESTFPLLPWPQRRQKQCFYC